MDPDRAAPAAEAPGVEKGGTLHVQAHTGLTTMDPTEAGYTDTKAILHDLVVRSLTQFVWDEDAGDMILVPDLATDLGTPNDDYTEWTFTLRSGVRFENGDEVTPEDVKFGILRSFDRETFPGGSSYSNQYFLDGDTYEGPYKSEADYKGIEIDGDTLTLKMSQPFPDLPYYVSFPSISPIPEGDASDPATYALHPLATGPYKFSEYTPNRSLTLVKNDQWDPDTDPGRHQYVDKIVFNFDAPQAKTEQTLLADAGEAKDLLTYNSVTAANYTSFMNKRPDALVAGAAPCTRWWSMDMTKITDKTVREALAWAYPYDNIYAASGMIPNVTRAYGSNMMPPGIPGREEYEAPEGLRPGQTDPEKARELLESAGALGFEIRFLYMTDDPLSVGAKDQTVKGLTEAGFKATPVATTSAQMPSVREDRNSDINVRDYGWCSSWPSGSSWLPPLFGSESLAQSGFSNNGSAFSEPAVDERIDEILSMPIDEQPAAWSDLDKTISREWFPTFVTGYYGTALIRGSNVQGFNIDTIRIMPTFKDIWLKR